MVAGEPAFYNDTEWLVEWSAWRDFQFKGVQGKFKAVLAPDGEDFILWSLASNQGKARINRESSFLHIVDGVLTVKGQRVTRIDFERQIIESFYQDVQTLKETVVDELPEDVIAEVESASEVEMFDKLKESKDFEELEINSTE